MYSKVKNNEGFTKGYIIDKFNVSERTVTRYIIEAVLDRLANAKVLEENQGEYMIETEMFGTGIKMWILSQGSAVEVIEPIEFREEIKSAIENMRSLYV